VVGFCEALWPPVRGKSSLPHLTVEGEVTVASLALMLNRFIFFFFRNTPTEREREGGGRERELVRIETATITQMGLPVENGACPYITIILQELIVEFNSELFALWSDISLLGDIVLAALIEHQLSHIYSTKIKVKRWRQPSLDN
jgi:hypothetical protein